MRRLAAVLVLIVAAGCSSNESGGPGAVSPTPTATATTTEPAQGNVKGGSAKADVSGQETFSVEVPLSTGDSQFNAPPAGFAFVFKDDKDNLITIGGESFDGSRPTAGTLALGVVFNREGRVIAHTDTSGGCEVTMKREGGAVSGTFQCGQIEDGRYSVKGTFSAELV
ncbi:MAG TPA: hypothetical protein VM841_09495 [Actinomycetota bacterium]|nr:hypothetical protein [Actinomycetota bacterium]